MVHIMTSKFYQGILTNVNECKQGIFIEFPKQTVARDAKYFLRTLGTQQEDESQNNTIRKKRLGK
jgi:hypothetical protein